MTLIEHDNEKVLENNMLACWLNGQAIQTLSLTERAFNYGDGLFSTIAIRQGQASLIDLHWQRLVQGCRRLLIDCQNLAQWQEDFLRFIALYPNCIAKIIVSRGVGGRGYLPEANQQTHCYFYAYPSHHHPQHYQQGIDTDFLQQRLSCGKLLAGLKHLNRLEQVLLRQELAQTSFPEAIVCNEQGYVIEGVFSNLFIIKNGQLQTPRLDLSGVDGVMRRHLLSLAQQILLPTQIINISPSDMLTADEVFFCNSLYGIWPVKRLAEKTFAQNPVTQQLQSLLHYV